MKLSSGIPPSTTAIAYQVRALSDHDFIMRYRRKGYAAIMARHSYAQRAARILELLGIDVPWRDGRFLNPR